MTEQKPPEHGEWWLYNANPECRVFILGANCSGHMVAVDRNDRYEVFNGVGNMALEFWHHEPLCTGFDWKPPAPIDPGEGWELLPVGTVLQDCDECCSHLGGGWIPTVCAGYRVGELEGTRNTYRRRKPPAETWPKYYLRTSGADSWVYRADGRYSIRNLTCDCVADPAEWYWRHGNMIEITESEALARVKTTEPIAHAVERTATPMVTAVVESPDDWVEITDPEHCIRVGLDWFCICGDDWEQQKHYHCDGPIGHWLADGQRVRCRRRDLPQLTPFPDQFAAVTTAIRAEKEATQPKRTPVRLYWYDGNIVGRYDHSPPTDQSFQELKFDGSGFYVTEGNSQW